MMKRALWLLAAGVVVAAGAPACSDDAAGELNRGPRGTSSGNPNDPNDPNNPNNPANQVPPEEQLFRKVEPDLQKKCGGSCHTDGTYVPKPPQFLAPPDAYKSIKGYPSAVTKDVYASSLLSKGPHAGPAVNTDPEFEKKLVEWLTAESLALAAQKLPSTPPFQVQNGPNDIDLTPAATGGLTGVHLTFDASLVGTILQLVNIKLVAPAGQDVHILQPRFVKVKADNSEVVDDSFSNLDQTVPGGAATTMSPGLVLFSSPDWFPFDLGAEKLRVEVQKLEKGKVQVIQGPAACKDANAFGAQVAGLLRGGSGINCAAGNCHGGGVGGYSLAGIANNGNNFADACAATLPKLNQGAAANSLIIQKAVNAGTPHSGGKVNNGQAFTNAFVNNINTIFF
ncbi:MAG: hypothetical protein R3B36_25055 [Polyangiaceae bacterium]